MTASLSPSRRSLLIALESILGNECFNASIQNYGPGGVRQSDGRNFRYPITLRNQDGTTVKVRDHSIPKETNDEMLRSGYYAFGANQLDVMAALDRILEYLEKNHELLLEKPSGPDEH